MAQQKVQSKTILIIRIIFFCHLGKLEKRNRNNKESLAIMKGDFFSNVFQKVGKVERVAVAVVFRR